ncbi:chaperone-like protein of POR1, chloroplastic, partial [Tanacetum coccineum]
PPVSVESPSARDLGIEAGVYGALAVLTYVNGASSPVGSLSGSDVPGLILASSFGASLYFMTKRNVKLGMALITYCPKNMHYLWKYQYYFLSFHGN